MTAHTLPLFVCILYLCVTSFAMQEESDGFMLTVDYAKEPSFLELNSAIAKQCKSQLTSIARELSDKTGRKIKPVNIVLRLSE